MVQMNRNRSSLKRSRKPTKSSGARRTKLFMILCVFIFLSAFTFVFLVSTAGQDGNGRTTRRHAISVSHWGWASNVSQVVGQLAGGSKSSSDVSVPMYGLVEKMAEVEETLAVNPHNFRYVLDPGPEVCSESVKPIYLVYIHSAPDHHKRRMLIRETWGSPYNMDDVDLRTIFMIGAASKPAVQEALELEFDRYRDIVQEDFVDSYRNLTYKAIMALQWVSTNCPDARIIIKADDDIFINIFTLVSHLKSLMKQKELMSESLDRMIVCNVWNQMKVIRDPSSKWYISKSEFPDDYFGTYCSGSAYAFTPSLAGSMFLVSKHVPFFWVDDYYITGMLPSKLTGISYESINKFYFLSSSAFFEKFSGNDTHLAIGHAHNVNNWKTVWKSVLKRRSKSLEDQNQPSSSSTFQTRPSSPLERGLPGLPGVRR